MMQLVQARSVAAAVESWYCFTVSVIILAASDYIVYLGLSYGAIVCTAPSETVAISPIVQPIVFAIVKCDRERSHSVGSQLERVPSKQHCFSEWGGDCGGEIQPALCSDNR